MMRTSEATVTCQATWDCNETEVDTRNCIPAPDFVRLAGLVVDIISDVFSRRRVQQRGMWDSDPCGLAIRPGDMSPNPDVINAVTKPAGIQP
jgi:hypothetical protein